MIISADYPGFSAPAQLNPTDGQMCIDRIQEMRRVLESADADDPRRPIVAACLAEHERVLGDFLNRCGCGPFGASE